MKMKRDVVSHISKLEQFSYLTTVTLFHSCKLVY